MSEGNKRGRKSTLTQEQMTTLDEGIDSGLSLKAAAERCGVKYHVARHYLVKVKGIEVKRGRKGGAVSQPEPTA